jgi:UDP-perosamine 4-acetyltransferase
MSTKGQMVIAGAGGHAAVLLEAIRTEGLWTVAALTDPLVRGELAGVPIVGGDEELEALYRKGVRGGIVGVGSIGAASIRIRLFEELGRIGFERPVVRHARSVVSETARLGGGTMVFACAVVNAGAEVGQNVIVNTAAVVEHGCRVGDHAHLAPRCVLGGDVEVGAEAHVGMGAVVLERRRIGRGAVVGAGAVVTRDVPDGTVVAGVPARILREVEAAVARGKR